MIKYLTPLKHFWVIISGAIILSSCYQTNKLNRFNRQKYLNLKINENRIQKKTIEPTVLASVDDNVVLNEPLATLNFDLTQDSLILIDETIIECIFHNAKKNIIVFSVKERDEMGKFKKWKRMTIPKKKVDKVVRKGRSNEVDNIIQNKTILPLGIKILLAIILIPIGISLLFFGIAGLAFVGSEALVYVLLGLIAIALLIWALTLPSY